MKLLESSRTLNPILKSLSYAFCILFFVACEQVSEMTEEQQAISQTFHRIEEVLAKDNGDFWNYPLYGPMVFVDPQTRIFIANQNNRDQTFTQLGDIYTDTLPENMIIANTATEWNNERWTMVMLPLPEDKKSQNNLIIHELFHRIQPAIEFDGLQELENGHLDVFTGRMLLILELEALRDAAMTEDKNARKQHLSNALYFRTQRQANETQKIAENTQELNEGLSEYTGVMLSGRTREELVEHFNQQIDFFYSNPTFVRSFAYQTIPLYGYLLSSEQTYWHKDISKETYLTDYFLEAFSVSIDENLDYIALAQQYNYNYEQHFFKEQKREEKRLAKISSYVQKFIEKPTFKIAFQDMRIFFDPKNLIPFESYGTIYPTIKVTDSWGILTVENEALIDPNWSSITVTPPQNQAASVIEGDGWKLELKEDWEVVKREKQFELRKKT